jgi:alpha-N-arabinofuranosidase
MKIIIIALSLIISSQLTLSQELNATITIDSRNIVGKLNSRVFGNNILSFQKGSYKYASQESWNRGGGIWDPDSQRSVSEIVKLAKLSGMSVIRYPGAQHYYDWKKTVGPISKRPDQQFGLPEFLQLCSDIGAIPLIIIPEYSGSAQDAADLVEYLNAPNDGRHTWAKQRVEDGHSSPWNVVWFEYGNETDSAKMSAAVYSQSYLTYLRAMKQVDANIKLGMVGTNEFPSLNYWFRNVLKIIGSQADFIIHHAYIPSYSRNDNIPEAKELFSISLGCEAQIQNYYDEMNKLAYELTGKHIPIAVTEYNGLFIQEKPVEYRLSLGNALLNAEMIKVFLNPENNIVMANSFQFCNQYWGAVKGYTYKHEPLVKRPLYYVFEMYHTHFGEELIQSDVICPKYDTYGGFGVVAAEGNGTEMNLLSSFVSLPTRWSIMQGEGCTTTLENDTVIVHFSGSKDVNYYHANKVFPAKPFTGYRFSAWMKTTDLSSDNGARIQIGDGRGWDKTYSASISPDIRGTSDWTKVYTDYISLPDAKDIIICVRRFSGGGSIRGEIKCTNPEIQEFIPKTFPAVPYLSVIASRKISSGSAEKSGNTKVYLMVINRNMIDSISTQINIQGMAPRNARAWILSGSTVDATNEVDPENITIHKNEYGKVKNGFKVHFPPHSLTALEIE